MRRPIAVIDAPGDTGLVEGVWDPVRIEQSLSNLISNALKYGASTPIDVVLSRTADRARIEVRDHGPGISEHDKARIFKPFFRSQRSSLIRGKL